MLEKSIDGMFYAVVGVDIRNLNSEHMDNQINEILYNKGDIDKIKGTYWAFPEEDKSLTIGEVIDRVRNLKKDDYNQRDFNKTDTTIARAINNCYTKVEDSERAQQNPDAISVIVQKDNEWQSASLSDILEQNPDYFTIKNGSMRDATNTKYQAINLIVGVEPGGGYKK
jgi:hypothetical protein